MQVHTEKRRYVRLHAYNLLANSIIFLYAYPSTEMYAELVFTENVAVADDLTDIALYEVIPRDQELRRAEKKYVAELEVSTTATLQ